MRGSQSILIAKRYPDGQTKDNKSIHSYPRDPLHPAFPLNFDTLNLSTRSIKANAANSVVTNPGESPTVET